MRRLLYPIASALLAFAYLAQAPAHAADVKVGILSTFTGPYAIWGDEYKRAVDLYLDQHNGKDGNPNVEVLWRDVGGDNPPRAHQLAQELIVRDNVAALGGLEFTTTVLALADLINEAKIPYVFFNSATGFVTDKSPYYVRVGFTLWTMETPAAKWAAAQGMKRCDIMVADYAPGTDTIDAFTKGFTDAGGTIVNTLRIPLGTTDFSSYFQRVQDDAPQCLNVFMPLGPMSAGVIKTFAERGLAQKGIQMIGVGETPEFDLPAIGDGAIGMVTALNYSPFLDNPTNKAFREAYQAKYGKDALPNFTSIAAYDGMELIFQMLRASGGQRDPDKMMAAVKGYSWASPRGPVSIDPATREITQNVYMRRVERVNGMLINKEFFTYPDVKEVWHDLHKTQ